MEILFIIIISYFLIHMYFTKKALLKPILYCLYSGVISLVLAKLNKPELALITLAINVFITGLLILINLHFSKYNHETLEVKKNYYTPLSSVFLFLLLGVFVVVVDRNYDLFTIPGDGKIMSTTLLESAIESNLISVTLIPMIIMIVSICFVFMFRRERIK